METNIICQHTTNKLLTNICSQCGCIYYNTDSILFSIKPKSFIYKPEIPPIEQFKAIEKSIGYRSYFSKNRNHVSDFYKKARLSCIKFIKLLCDEYKCSYRVYVTSILYLDLIYLNYDYYSTLKDFKSELIALGCFIVSCKIFKSKFINIVKFIDSAIKIPSYRSIKMFTFKEVSYEMNEVRKYEDYVLKFLSFRLDYYTTFSVLEFFLLNGIIFNNEIKISLDDTSALYEKIKTLNKLTFKILNSSIEEIAYTNFNHIEVALSCIVYARELMKIKNAFPVEFEKIYNIKLCNIVECYRFISL